jgi:REP element-mobilizing transposase RayT
MARNVSTEKRPRGGKRQGAGRKKNGRRLDHAHARRPLLSSRHPVHVVLRTLASVPRLRDRDGYRAMRRVLTRYLGLDDFRVVHLSLQHNHIHLLVEAENQNVLARRMQSFAINAARAINKSNRAYGKVFAYRYHATQITTARYARHALAYVLNNWRHHREDAAHIDAIKARLDPYASGISFTGWINETRFACPSGYTPLPVSPAQTSLLAFEWKRYGLIDEWERPGPFRW